jgi:hypothetical protein
MTPAISEEARLVAADILAREVAVLLKLVGLGGYCRFLQLRRAFENYQACVLRDSGWPEAMEPERCPECLVRMFLVTPSAGGKPLLMCPQCHPITFSRADSSKGKGEP